MLPPGTLRALQGNADAIVLVVALAMTLAALAAGAPAWAVLAALAIVLVAFHIRGLASDRHRERMARAAIEQEMARVGALEARLRQRDEERRQR